MAQVLMVNKCQLLLTRQRVDSQQDNDDNDGDKDDREPGAGGGGSRDGVTTTTLVLITIIHFKCFGMWRCCCFCSVQLSPFILSMMDDEQETEKGEKVDCLHFTPSTARCV